MEMGTMGMAATQAAPAAVATGERLRLTAAQRLHVDVYGFVLLDDVLSPDEVARMKEALYRLKAEPDPAAHRVYMNSRDAHHVHFGHLVEYDPALLEYAAHPKLIPLVEEVVGGSVRLEESEAIINRRDPNADLSAWAGRRVVPTGFHTGTRHGWGTYMQNHHFHCLFVKTLAYLTDVGPDDGGTAVIPGSHRLTWPERAIVDAALSDERLIYQVEARAGSVLLFPESLVHSTTAIRSDNERVILVCGYTPPMMREWPGNEISPEFVAALPEEIRPLISGSDSWDWRRHVDD
jgi:ectoine hydroxylase-related dioxygenase (phytanoyl-CoA dioxygenase family)